MGNVFLQHEDQMIISEEEKKLLEEEGHFLPTNVALTKVSRGLFIFTLPEVMYLM